MSFMAHQRIRPALALLALCILTALSVLHTRPATAQTTNRVGVLQGYYDALAQGDVEGMLSGYTDNAVFISPSGLCAMPSPCVGKDAIRPRFQQMVDAHYCETPTGFDVTGSVVAGRKEVRNDALRANGIARLIAVTFFQMPQDKVSFAVSYIDASEPQTVANNAITAGTQVRGTPIPAPDVPCG